MLRRDGDVFLFGTAMAVQLLDPSPEFVGGSRTTAIAGPGMGGKTSRGVNRKPAGVSRSPESIPTRLRALAVRPLQQESLGWHGNA